jgi:hypothetical protein
MWESISLYGNMHSAHIYSLDGRRSENFRRALSRARPMECNALVVLTVLTRFQAAAVVTPGFAIREKSQCGMRKAGNREGLCQLRHAVNVQDMPGDLGGCL